MTQTILNEEALKSLTENDTKQTRQMVDHPPHYTSHPSGIECIEITRHMCSNLGNAFKYIWRCDLKRTAIEDLEKAIFYLRDEIKLRRSRLPETELGDKIPVKVRPGESMAKAVERTRAENLIKELDVWGN